MKVTFVQFVAGWRNLDCELRIYGEQKQYGGLILKTTHQSKDGSLAHPPNGCCYLGLLPERLKPASG